IVTSTIKVTHKIPKPETTRDIVYLVSLKDGDPAQVFPTDPRQSLASGRDAHSAVLEVKTAGLQEGPVGPERVDDQYLRPNALVTSADPRVKELAAKAV